MRIVMCAVALAAAVAAPVIGQDKPQPSGQHMSSMAMHDAEFSQMMAQHHQGGIEMAQHEQKMGSSAQMKALAGKILKGQQEDLPTLRAHAKGQKMSGMMAEHQKEMQKTHMEMMSRLRAAKGAELDKVFAEEMIKHHEDGLKMMEQAQLQDAKLKSLVSSMQAKQRKEIDELKSASGGQP